MASKDADVCPVDHKARETWLQTSQQQRQTPPPSTPTTAKTTTSSSPLPSSCDSSTMDQTASLSSTLQIPKPRFTNSRLSTDREVSTIPRGGLSPQSPSPPPTTTTSPNAQSSSNPHTSPSGQWVYPSEAQFFAAMQRKNHTPRTADMSSVIPIHNAVNERTWHDILLWEKGRGGEACGGPRLVSFSGDSQKLTPRARWYGLLGYQAPFDRHDWVVERCGRRVEYVIDFYEGKPVAVEEKGKAPLSFHLDVRPKLNSFEGWKMRAERFLGLDA